VRKAGVLGKGVFAKQNISKDELIADWTKGKVYWAKKCSDLPKDIADHAIQFSMHEWIDIKESRYLNPSCEPNCGLMENFNLWQ